MRSALPPPPQAQCFFAVGHVGCIHARGQSDVGHVSHGFLCAHVGHVSHDFYMTYMTYIMQGWRGAKNVGRGGV